MHNKKTRNRTTPDEIADYHNENSDTQKLV